MDTNTSRLGGQPARPAPQRPVPSQVPPGAQPGMTPQPGPTPKPPPPPMSEVWQPQPAVATGTVLDELMELMDVRVWEVFIPLVTYCQMVDDLARGDANWKAEYEGAVLSPFLGFGPAHMWNAMQSDIKGGMLREMSRWMQDPDKREAGSLTWHMMDLFVPGFCRMSKGQEAHDASLLVLKRIRPEFS